MPQNYQIKVRKRTVDEETGEPLSPFEFVTDDSEVLVACATAWDESGTQAPTTAAPVNAAAGEWTVAVPNYLLPSLIDSAGEGHYVGGAPTEYKIDTIHH